jgi:cytochrome c peroxidase
MTLRNNFRIFVPVMVFATSVGAGELPEPIADDMFAAFDFHTLELATIGRDLFFDPILSGNENIACSTCHHPSLGTSDAVSLSIGEGGDGLGEKRVDHSVNTPISRIPRNAPALFNLGAKEFSRMFHDGRVEANENAPFGVTMPAGRTLERVVTSPLVAQTMLPVLSDNEMAGHEGENEIADAVAAGKIRGEGGAWDLLAKRVEAIPAYRMALQRQIGTDRPLHYIDIAEALAAFISVEFRTSQSPFDAYLAGDSAALNASEMRGMDLFYNEGGCDSCHSGSFQTDHEFHAIGIPQFGPGKNADRLTYGDSGRHIVTGADEDLFAFRTPSLRNIELSAPYGHNGAYSTLRDVVEHHLQPLRALAHYDLDKAVLHSVKFATDDTQAMNDLEELLRMAAAIELEPRYFAPADVDDLVAFLGALTDTRAEVSRLGVPSEVPSGLSTDQANPHRVVEAQNPGKVKPKVRRAAFNNLVIVKREPCVPPETDLQCN